VEWNNSIGFYDCESGDLIFADTSKVPPPPDPGWAYPHPESPQAIQNEFEKMNSDPWGHGLICFQMVETGLLVLLPDACGGKCSCPVRGVVRARPGRGRGAKPGGRSRRRPDRPDRSTPRRPKRPNPAELDTGDRIKRVKPGQQLPGKFRLTPAEL